MNEKGGAKRPPSLDIRYSVLDIGCSERIQRINGITLDSDKDPVGAGPRARPFSRMEKRAATGTRPCSGI